MKRTWLLVALFILLGAGAFYVLKQKKTQTGSRTSWDMEFAMADPDDIQKIFLADRAMNTATLERQKDGAWLYNGRYPARPTAIQTLLQTLTTVKVYYIPAEAAKNNIIKTLGAEGIKVEVYDRSGERRKVYYVGGVTNDESGTFMMMEGSNQPYVTHIPGFIGQLRARFFMGEDDWRDRTIFAERPENIQSIAVQYPQQKNESFKLEKTGEAQYEVRPYFTTTPASNKPQRKGLAEAYLLQYEKLGAEAYETRNRLRDSVTNLVPFAIVELKKTDGTEKTVRFWPVAVQRTTDTHEIYVERYFTETNGDFLLTQEAVFGPIFRGYSFFFEGKAPKVLQ